MSDILVVDDDPKNLTAMDVALGDLSHRLVKVASGEEALRQILERDFAVILLDVQMPTLDGFETARIIRSRHRNRHVPIIFVTAYSQNDTDMRYGYQLGAVDYLFKPIVPEVLRAKVQVFVELKERSAEVRRQGAQLQEMERLAAERRLEEERRSWEQRALERQMTEQRRINAQLEEADRRKDEFIAMLAHELRNPLAPIVTSLELMRMIELGDPLLVQARDAMERQVHHLTRLVDDLLDVSRISQGKIELHEDVVDLARIIDHAVETCRGLMEQAEHELLVEPPEAPLLVDADAVRLTQVFANLLSNAARYTDPGGKVSIRCGLEEDRAVVRVRDNGRGIAPELIDRIFDMFVQERDGGKGLGLGLTLVKQLVEMHGGTVEARSGGRGRGSEFVVSLPLADRDSDASVLEEGEDDLAGGRSLRIALVEDDEDVRNTVRSLLERWGHEVSVAPDGILGVELVLQSHPDVALVDIGLPGLDGYGLARRVRAELGPGGPRLIAITGFGQEHDRRRALDAGFDAHLVKPATPKAIRRTLRALS